MTWLRRLVKNVVGALVARIEKSHIVLRYRLRKSGVTVWWPCNIYPTARIGENVSVGMYSEIGDGVIIGNNVRIGKGAFIPKGVVICDGAFIGPHVCFSNDMYPPSSKEDWKTTVVGERAALGAGVTVIPGAHIGADALIGAGAVVTRNVPAGEIWAGVPARLKRRKGDGSNRL